MNKRLYILMIMIITVFLQPMNTLAYSYGDPGEEQFAEAYRELEKYIEQENWSSAEEVYESYQKEFELYFKKTMPYIDKAFQEKDKELLLQSYQAALRLNIERRLHFAVDKFDDYGQAKLLLAKARGTFNVLEPIAISKADQATVDQMYNNFDKALEALGNPGLFGIGNKENDPEAFKQLTEEIVTKTKELFPVPEEEGDKSHLTEENLSLDDELTGSSTFWLWFTVILVISFIGIILINRRRK